MSIRLRSSNRAGPRRAFAMLARLGINLVLAYLAAFVAAVAGFALADAIEHDPLGPGALENALYGLGWLMFGAPAVLLVLIGLDLALYHVERQRRVALAVSLAPAALMAIFVVAAPAILSTVAWLAATGFAFGMTMRVPPRSVAPSSSERAHLPPFGNPMQPPP